jgi:glycosyltransferase involved in cell wall biosynthesis
MDFHGDAQSRPEFPDSAAPTKTHPIAVTLLTGGIDGHYLFGLATSLLSKGVTLDVIGSDEVDLPQFRNRLDVNFLNLRGSQQSNVSFLRKSLRVSKYYAKLIRYAATARPKVFHILWNNKFEVVDRTFLMIFYRLLNKKIVFTAHNVNQGRRDSHDTWLNRLTLQIQYRLSHHIFVHTEKMKRELIDEFGVKDVRVTVIPYGINNAVPDTQLTPADAKKRLGLRDHERTLLFFGRIAPYKGLEHLVSAVLQVLGRRDDYRLIVAGMPDRCEEYWSTVLNEIHENIQGEKIILKPEFIPDDEIEVFFKAADVLVLPYKEIFQSGILFLGQSFGLPVLASDVGSFKDEVVEGKTGMIFIPADTADLVRAIELYFASDLFKDLTNRRRDISAYANERHSWNTVGQLTASVYAGLLQLPSLEKVLNCVAPSRASLEVHVPPN